MSIEERNKAIARRYHGEIMSDGDLSVIDDLMHPDFKFAVPTYPAHFYGLEGFKHVVTMLHGAFVDLRFQIEDLVAQGDLVASHWTGTGIHAGHALHTVEGELPASGKSFRIDGMTWLTIRDGKIVELVGNEDTLGLLMQLGFLASPGPPPAPPSPQRHLEVARRYFEELMNERRLQVIDEIMAPDVVLRVATQAEAMRGYDGVRQFVQSLTTAFPDIRFTIEHLIGEQTRVAARWTVTGTHRGPFLGIVPTGNPINDQGTTFFAFHQGTIVAVWVNENGLGLLQQMGAIPVSSQAPGISPGQAVDAAALAELETMVLDAPSPEGEE